MGWSSIRRYDVQANYASVLAIVSSLPFLAAAWLLCSRYEHELGQIVYDDKSLFLPAFLACLSLSVLPGGVGFVLGLSSAGQRRNDRATRSWVGFFLGGGIVTLDAILLIAFWMLRLAKPM